MDIRLTNNDPDFEKVQGHRKARALKYNAKILFWVGLITLPLFGFGLLLWLLAIVVNIKANKLKYKYQT